MFALLDISSQKLTNIDDILRFFELLIAVPRHIPKEMLKVGETTCSEQDLLPLRIGCGAYVRLTFPSREWNQDGCSKLGSFIAAVREDHKAWNLGRVGGLSPHWGSTSRRNLANIFWIFCTTFGKMWSFGQICRTVGQKFRIVLKHLIIC